MKLLEPFRRHRGKTIVMLLTMALLGWLIYLHRDDLSKEAIFKFGHELPVTGFLALFLILPLTGFSVSIFMILAGIRFGFAGGMAVTAGMVLIHNIAAYRLTHGLFRTRFRNFLERSGYAIPPIDPRHRVRFTALFTAIHGPPYAAKLYLLALTDIPFRIYLWVGAPIYIAFAAIPVGAGSAVTTLNLKWIYIVVGCLALLPLISYGLRKRFRQSPDSG
jgi:uncharacterized membrane protein YdjX (TVP38/TMEM64 family)